MKELVLFFDADATASAIYNDELLPILEPLGLLRTRRASDVEPYAGGWVAWIRPWVDRLAQRQWIAPEGVPLLARNALGPFRTRAEALAAEVAYLRRVL